MPEVWLRTISCGRPYDLMVIDRPQLQTAPCYILPITVTDLMVIGKTRNWSMLLALLWQTLR